MYAPIERRQLHGLPLKFEKLEWLEKKLKKLNPTYQLVVSRRMFDVAYMEEYQFTVVRWEAPMKTKRTLVLETTDLEQMESALFMLINVEEENQRS